MSVLLSVCVTQLQPQQGIVNVLKSPAAEKACAVLCSVPSAERLAALSWVPPPALFSPLQSVEGSMQWEGTECWERGRSDSRHPAHRTGPARGTPREQALVTHDSSVEGTGTR